MTPEPVVLRAHPAERHPQRRVLLHGLANGAAFWGEVLARRPQWMECRTAELPWRVDGPLDWSHSGDLPGWIATAVAGVVGTADTIVAHARAHRTTDPERRTEMARRVCERVGPYGWTWFFETYMRTPWLRTDLIHVPTLVVTGGQDAAVTEARDPAEEIPDGTLEVEPRCGHFPMVENPDWFATVLSRFLDPDLTQFPSDRREPSMAVGARG